MYIVFLDDMEVPIAPDQIQIKINGKNKTVTLVNESEINILKKAGLSDISFKLRIPHNPLPFARNLQSVTYYLNKLELMKVNQKPFQFIVVRPGMYNTNLTVSLEDYRIDENAKNGEMTVVDIQLKQFRDYGDVKAKIEEKTVDGNIVLTVQKEKDRLDTRETPKQVTTKAGDTLWGIAKKYLGDGSKASELQKLNNLSHPNAILPGWVIRLE